MKKTLLLLSLLLLACRDSSKSPDQELGKSMVSEPSKPAVPNTTVTGTAAAALDTPKVRAVVYYEIAAVACNFGQGDYPEATKPKWRRVAGEALAAKARLEKRGNFSIKAGEELDGETSAGLTSLESLVGVFDPNVEMGWSTLQQTLWIRDEFPSKELDSDLPFPTQPNIPQAYRFLAGALPAITSRRLGGQNDNRLPHFACLDQMK